jgi:hypothetical protein
MLPLFFHIIFPWIFHIFWTEFNNIVLEEGGSRYVAVAHIQNNITYNPTKVVLGYHLYSWENDQGYVYFHFKLNYSQFSAEFFTPLTLAHLTSTCCLKHCISNAIHPGLNFGLKAGKEFVRFCENAFTLFAPHARMYDLVYVITQKLLWWWFWNKMNILQQI